VIEKRLVHFFVEPHFFDKTQTFVLDIATFSSIIYIWYEGGELSAIPSEVEMSTSPLPKLET